MTELNRLIDAANDAEPDNTRFRVGSFKIQLTVAGETFYAHKIDLAYAQDQLASASVFIALGTVAGAKYGEEANQATLAKLSLIQPGKPVSIQVTFNEVDVGEGDDPDIGPALPVGSYTAFTGIVVGSFYEHSAKSMIGFRINAVHDKIRLGAATSLSGGLVPSSIFDIFIDATDFLVSGSTQEADIDLESDDLWGGIIRPTIEFYLSNQRINDPGNQLNTGPHSSTFARLLAARQSFAEQLAEVISLITIKANLNQLRNNHPIVQLINAMVSRPGNTTNGLAMIQQVLQSFLCSFNCLASQFVVYPWWPYYSADNMLGLRAGSFYFTRFAQQSQIQSLASIPLASGVTLRPVPYLNAISAESGIVGSYFYDGFGDDVLPFASGLFHRVPQWLQTTTNPDVTGNVSGQRNPRVISSFTPQTAENQDVVRPAKASLGGDPPISAGASHPYNVLARMHALDALFANNAATAITPLRIDIVPGMVIRMDVYRFGETTVTKKNGIYGHVQSVGISLDAVSGVAQTELGLSHVRTDFDQERLSEGDVGHPAFEPVLNRLNELSLWDDQSSEA